MAHFCQGSAKGCPWIVALIRTKTPDFFTEAGVFVEIKDRPLFRLGGTQKPPYRSKAMGGFC